MHCYKYVHFAAESLPPLLFDLATDPNELCDLASDAAHASGLLHCMRAMLSWQMAHRDHALTHVRVSARDGVVDTPSPVYARM
eukprot:SAG22_NODE_18157_length_292_cov_0.803109_1_plen_83_part_01